MVSVETGQIEQITLTFKEWPVNWPCILFLGIVERASENKNRDAFIDRKRKELGVGKGGNRRQFFSRARSVSGFTKLSIKNNVCEQDIIELQIIVSQQPMSELK